MTNNKIELLPEHIIDQIKAGEVIERPANIIKELLENAIDAGSNKIEIEIKGNGMELIHIKDNGHGIEFDDLPYAFSRHATSKIKKFEDLYSLYTYGFRGEALASVASVSKVVCKSRTDKTSGRYQIEGPQVIGHDHLETYNHIGSEFFIKDLFFNTPVRIKFLKSGQSEKNQLTKILNAFFLNNPEIEFSIKWDDFEKHVYKKASNYLERVSDIIKNDSFIQLENNYNNSNVKIILGKKASRSSVGKFQYIFVNGRIIVDKRIHNIIINSAQSHWNDGGMGNYICFLNLPPNEIDVNVHPNKTIVKIYQSSNIYSLINSTIKSELQPKKNINTPLNIHAPQNQSFDFSTPTYLDFNLKDLNQHKEEFSKEKANSSFKISSNFNILEIEENFYLVNLEKLVKSFLLTNIRIESIQQIPLLISEPIKKKISHLKQAKQAGFEIDDFSNSSLLRAIPQYLEHFYYVETLILLDDLNFKESSIEKSDSILNIIENPIMLFNQNELLNYLKENIIIKLDNSSLNKLFK